MLFDYAGKTYRTERAVYVAMYEARESKGRTSRELAEEILLQEFGTSPKSKDAFASKRLWRSSPPSTASATRNSHATSPPARSKASRPA